MNYNSNFRLLSLLATYFIAGILSAPIEAEIDGDSGVEPAEDVKEEIHMPETNAGTENVEQNSRALSLPFLPPSTSNEVTGKEAPGFFNSGGKLYMGTFQSVGIPMPKISDVFGMLGNFGNFPKLPTLPGVPNLPGLGNSES